MRRALLLAIVCIVAFVTAAYRSCDRSDRAAPRLRAGATAAPKVKRVSAVRGTVAGTVRDARGPLARASVCVTGELEACATTDPQGRYHIAVAPGSYVVHASAAQHRPAQAAVEVAGDATIDLELRVGGVALTGTVSDLSGGPIARARIVADLAVVETADDGTFSVWVAPGAIVIAVSAEGYAPLVDQVHAPSRVELALVPEGTITGVVIDAATRAPVPGVRVAASLARVTATVTDEHGAFRLAGLPAGAMELTATSPTGYGRSSGSIVVGVAATTSDIVVELHRAVTVTGHVMVDKAPCADAIVELTDPAKAREVSLDSRGDAVVAEGVLPGTYDVEIECASGTARTYPPVVVGTEPVEVTWQLDRGAQVSGRVTSRAGVAIEQAYVTARSLGDEDARSRGAHTDADGRYVIDGIRPGAATISVTRELGVYDARVELARGASIQQDFVIDDLGRLTGSVRDEAGAPVAGYLVGAEPLDETSAFTDLGAKTDADGTFTIDRVPPATYDVHASSPRSTDDVRARVTVHGNDTARVDLAIKRPSGTISGTVSDRAGRPVGDAFVRIASEQTPDRWDELRSDWGDKTMTAVDGTFAIREVPPGSYTVRAYRAARSDVVVEHVSPDAKLRLVLRPTGSIAGTVRSWNATLDDLTIFIKDERVGYSRSERFFRTGGAFSIEELPAGHYTIAAGAEGQEAQIELDLAEGERKQNVAIALVPLVTVTGRVLDHRTKQPVAKVEVFVRPASSTSTRFSGTDAGVTDANGRFTVARVPVGKLLVGCFEPGIHEAYALRGAAGRGPVDLGDIFVVRKHAGTAGDAGLELAMIGDLDEDQVAKVERVIPGGPAALAGVVAGDVITSVDGIDTRGFGALAAANALNAPAGTRVSLTLARGMTVSLVLR